MRPLALALAAALLLTACNDDGRELAPAPSLDTVPPAEIGPGSEGPGSDFVLTSPAFGPGELIDAVHTCDGLDVAPTVTGSGVPAATAELALVVVDLDADDYVHWVVAGLPPQQTQIDDATIPEQAVLARTTGGRLGWEGPCPPTGDEPHRYVFTLYAMAEPIGLAPNLDGREALAIIQEAALSSTSLLGLYARPAVG